MTIHQSLKKFLSKPTCPNSSLRWEGTHPLQHWMLPMETLIWSHFITSFK